MPDNTLTADQSQVKLLIKHWRKFNSVRMWAFIITGWGLILAQLIGYFYLKNLSFTTLMVSCFIISAASFIFRRYCNTKFAQQMTAEEQSLCERCDAIATSELNKQFLSELSKESRKVNPQKEYLRTSVKVEDDTLLRAAAYTENAPQDQLLRPAADDKPHPSSGKSH